MLILKHNISVLNDDEIIEHVTNFENVPGDHEIKDVDDGECQSAMPKGPKFFQMHRGISNNEAILHFQIWKWNGYHKKLARSCIYL